MNACRMTVVTFAMLIATAARADDAKAITAAGKVDAVTLYRGQAMVSRTVSVDAPRGAVELVVPDLPSGVVPDSLFAEGAEGLQVRAVRFRTRAVGEAPREEVRKLDEQVATLQAESQQIIASLELIKQQLQYLDKLEGFVAPTAQAELTKGVLDAEQLMKVTEFTFSRRLEATKQRLALDQRQQKLAEEMSLLQRKRAELTSSASKTLLEAVVFLDKKADQPGSVRLTYLAGGCGWSPSYNFRATAEAKAVQMEYNAIIAQRSGEDWNDVELTLSTASPVLSAKGPGLAPFEVTLAAGDNLGNNSPVPQGKLNEQYKAIQQKRAAAQEGQVQAYGNKASLDNAWRFNLAANDAQTLELMCATDALRSLEEESSALGEGPSIDYRLPNRISMASRNDQQIVQVMRADLEGMVYHIATPVLTTYVYREAEIINTSDEDLLGGPINVYLDGRFVGRGEISTVARGQTFVVGFGADPQLRARRELVKKDEIVQGGNRVLSFDYRLTIDNFKKEPVLVRVIDRLPYAQRENEIKVTLDTAKHALSDDAFYLRRERPRGILRWDVDVPAGVAGETAAAVEYNYTLEFSKSLAITSPGSDGNSVEERQQDLNQLEQFRQNRK